MQTDRNSWFGSGFQSNHLHAQTLIFKSEWNAQSCTWYYETVQDFSIGSITTRRYLIPIKKYLCFITFTYYMLYDVKKYLKKFLKWMETEARAQSLSQKWKFGRNYANVDIKFFCSFLFFRIPWACFMYFIWTCSVAITYYLWGNFNDFRELDIKWWQFIIPVKSVNIRSQFQCYTLFRLNQYSHWKDVFSG